MPETFPIWLLVICIVLAVAAGLWVGGRAHREIEGRRPTGQRTIAQRIRTGVSRSVVSLWKWNRARGRPAEPSEPEE